MVKAILVLVLIFAICACSCDGKSMRTTINGKSVPLVTLRESVPTGYSVGPHGLAMSSWPKDHGDGANSGFGVGKGALGTIKLQIPLPYFGSAPAIGEDGTVYVGSADGFLIALDPATGSGKWRVFTGGTEVDAAPAVSMQHIVYISGGDDSHTGSILDPKNAVVALNSETGGTIWKMPMPTSVGSPTIAIDGSVIVGGLDGVVYDLNGATGALIWSTRVGDKVNATSAIGTDGMAVIGSGNGFLFKLNASTGAVIWKTQLGGPILSSACIAKDGTAFQGAFDNCIYAVNGGTGHVLWKTKLGSDPVPGLPDSVDSTPAIGSTGLIYVNAENYLFALSATSGAIKWKCDIGGEGNDSSPIVGGDGTVYDGSEDGNMYAIDGRTGAIVWKVKVGKISQTNPALSADGTIYFGSMDSDTVYAVK